MEINSLKNKLFDEFHNDVQIVLNPDGEFVALENSAVFICHYVGHSLRYDKICDSVDHAICECRSLLKVHPQFTFYVICQTIKTYNYAKLQVSK